MHGLQKKLQVIFDNNKFINKMKKLLIFAVFFLNFNFCFSQNKVFLSSESSWVSVVEFSDWLEDNVDNYLGKYEFIHSPNDNNGVYNGEGDGYYDIMTLENKSGQLFVYTFGEVEGWSEAEIDTMKNPKIENGYLLSDNKNEDVTVNQYKNLKFVILKYKDRKGKIKKVKGVLDLQGGDETYFYEKNNNSVQGKIEIDSTQSFIFLDKALQFEISENDFLNDFPDFKKI